MATFGEGPVLGLDLTAAPHQEQPFKPLKSASDLPEGLPRVLHSPVVWTGTQYRHTKEYVIFVGQKHKQELEKALREFKERGLDGTLVCRESFPLPELGPKLDTLRRDLYSGRGFGCVRGLNTAEYPVEDLTILQLGIQAHIANRYGRQDKKGNMMVHIKADNSSQVSADHHRHSTAPITFHNEEAGDIVSWLTRSCAEVGGRCIIASAHTVYNVLAASRPDLVRVLMRADWPFALPKFHCRPVLFHHEGNIIMNFGRTPLLGSASHPRPSDLPSLTALQKEALDAIETIGRATQLEMRTEPGDIHFINNLSVLHRREGFVDGSGASKKRHLVRMRLRDEQMGWAIPPELRDEWDRAFANGKPTMWHLQPMPEGFFPLRTQAN